MIRGIRGAIKVRANHKEDIIEATQTLIRKIVKLNDIKVSDITSIFFTLTRDLDAEFPAMAVRAMKEGWEYVPCLSALEIDTPDAMERCLRILIHVNTDKSYNEIQHVYLGETSIYRPEIT